MRRSLCQLCYCASRLDGIYQEVKLNAISVFFLKMDINTKSWVRIADIVWVCSFTLGLLLKTVNH